MGNKYHNKILVKQAQLLALHNKYVKAMQAGQQAIQKMASLQESQQNLYHRVLHALKNQH